mgnify:CR=1 FL=1
MFVERARSSVICVPDAKRKLERGLEKARLDGGWCVWFQDVCGYLDGVGGRGVE